MDESIWDRTTIAKFRQKLGSELIDKLMAKVIKLCADHGMIDGEHEVLDGTSSIAWSRIVGSCDNIYVETPDYNSNKNFKN